MCSRDRPRSTLLSTIANCQLEKTEKTRLESRGPAGGGSGLASRTSPILSGKPRISRQKSRNVRDDGQPIGSGCCQQRQPGGLDQPQESRRGARPDLGQWSRVLRHSLPARLRAPGARESRTTGRPRRLGTGVAALARRGPNCRRDLEGRSGPDSLSGKLAARANNP
jgi:hypothetical protein